MRINADKSVWLVRSVYLHFHAACYADKASMPEVDLLTSYTSFDGASALLIRDKQRGLAAWIFKPVSYDEVRVVLGTLDEFRYDDRLCPQPTPACKRYWIPQTQFQKAVDVLKQFFETADFPPMNN